MILLNVGAGGTLPRGDWVNVDFPYEHPEMGGNYVRHDVRVQPWPFAGDSVDGLIACHLLEHFDTQDGVDFLRECRRVLKPGGVCRIVVPDASYFRKVYAEDAADPEGNAERLFGEPLAGRGWSHMAGRPARLTHNSFMEFALFWVEHRQLFTEDSLWCEMVAAGFGPDRMYVVGHQQTGEPGHYCAAHVAALDNREKFSLRLEAVK